MVLGNLRRKVGGVFSKLDSINFSIGDLSLWEGLGMVIGWVLWTLNNTFMLKGILLLLLHRFLQLVKL